MISAYSIAAVFFMIIAAGAMYYNVASRSPFFLDIFGKKYARESKTVTGVVDRLEWGAGGGYWMICHIGENGVEAKIPNMRTSGGITPGSEIQLVLLKDVNCEVYLPQNHRNEKSFADCMVMDVEKIAQQNKKAQIIFIAAAVGSLLGFVFLQSIPVLSCVLFLISAAAFTFSKPLLDWKKCEECCKIDVKEAKKEKSADPGSQPGAFPPDYDHWSQTQKDLYGITVRLEAERMAGKEDAEMNEEDFSADGWVNIQEPSIDCPAPTEEKLSYEGIVPKACKNCGCIVDNDAFYCPNCGAPQKRMENFPKHWEALEAFEGAQDIVTDPESTKEAPCSEANESADDAEYQGQKEKQQRPNSSRRGKKAKNRRHRPETTADGTDVDKVIQSLESTSQSTL